jgi:hypothetical protein
LKNLLDLAEGPVEVLVAYDDDDLASHNALRILDLYPDHKLKTNIVPRKGYSRLNEYYNLLASESIGSWLMLWNDDAAMKTQGWDRRIEEVAAARPDSLVIELQDQMWPALCCFPVVRRMAVRAVGGFSPHTPHCDTYWQDMGRTLGRSNPADVFLSHDRFDITGKNNDPTYEEGQSGYKTADYYNVSTQRRIRDDMEKLKRI